MKNVSFWFGSGAHVCCYYYFSHLLKVTFFANKQTQETSNSSSQRRKIVDISGKHGKKSDEQAKQL